MEDPIGADYEHKGLKLMDGKEREELLNNLEFSSIWECCGHEVFDKQTVKIVQSNLPFFSQIPKSSVFKKNFNKSLSCYSEITFLSQLQEESIFSYNQYISK